MLESIEQARTELAARLRERRSEIEEALLTRTYAIADPKETANPEYAQGLRAAVSAALDYGLEAVEHGEERAPPVPALLLVQARLAARNGVPLDTVLRRYFAGYTLLGDFIVQEAGAANLTEPWLKQLLREQGVLFDGFLAAVAEEYGREGRRPSSTEERRAERVRRLLGGELLEASGIEYDFDTNHLGVAASGPGAVEAIRELADILDRRLLSIRHEEEIWAWLGGQRRIEYKELRRLLATGGREGSTLSIGEPAEGLAGWRLTHRQATAALPIALRMERSITWYADVAIIASILEDDLLANSLRTMYIDPLATGRDEGQIAFETLRAYFAVGRNVTSAAASLGLNRNTVAKRLRDVEAVLGRSLSACVSDLETALRLRDFQRGT